MPLNIFNGHEVKNINSILRGALDNGGFGSSPVSAYYGSGIYMQSIKVLSDAATTAPLVLASPDGEIITEHRALDTWQNVNSEFDASQFMINIVSALNVYGVAYIQKVRSGNGEPIQLFSLNPSTIEVVMSPNGIKSFRQRTNGQVTAEYPREDIVYIQGIYDPANDLGGLSSLSFAMGAAANEREMTNTLAQFWRRGAIGQVLFSSPESLTATSATAYANAIREFIGGLNNRFRALVLGQDLKPVQLGFPIKDLDVAGMTNSIREAVSVATGVPGILIVPTNAADLTPIQLAQSWFYQNTVNALWRKISERLNSEYRPEYQDLMDGGLKFEFDVSEHPAFIDDADKMQARVLAQLDKGLLTKEAAASALGIAPEDMPQAAPVVVNSPMPQSAPMTDSTPADSMSATDNQATRAMRDEQLWRVKSINAVNKGKPALVAFASDSIPAARHATIAAKLASATTPDEVRDAFEMVSNDAKQYDPALVALLGEVKAAREALANSPQPKDDDMRLSIKANNVTIQNDEAVKTMQAMVNTMKELTQPMPQPTINITTPAPVVNVTNEVPQAAAAVVNVQASPVTVENVVNVPQPAQRDIALKVTRDGRGNVTGVTGGSDAK